MACVLASPAGAQSLDALRGMSIDELAQVNVSSVSKADQPLADAPAAIYVIDHEDIVRSGAATIPEMLRLAPNLQTFEQAPGKWVVTARGLNGSENAQNFPNKLLVLVDGRAVYTPLFSGVYWDLPDVLPDNVERIEVISGPGAALWGANAVNGVINIITRNAGQTSGFYTDLRAGPDRQIGGVRIGGALGDQVAYRADIRALREDAFRTATGAPAHDAWERLGGSFRLDWAPSAADQVSLLGEATTGDHLVPGGKEDIAARSLTLRWNRHEANGGELQGQLYYDRSQRDERPSGGGEFHVDTYDGEVQRSWLFGSHHVVAGAGARLAAYVINGTASLFFVPPSDTLFIANAFAQDSFALTPALSATAGLKVEHLPYAGTSLSPELRLAWKPLATTLVWASVERAVRSPTPFDDTVQERAGFVSLSVNPQFRTEKLVAAELGVRAQPVRTFSFSVTGFFHHYDDLRTVELVPAPGFVLTWGNGLAGNSYGIEAWADWRPASWWTLSAGGTWLEEDFHFKPGASGIVGVSQLGSDRPYQAKLRSSMNLAKRLTLDVDFRAAGPLPNPRVRAFQEAGARLAWEAAPGVTLSVSGTNLIHDWHQEYPGGDLIPRRVMAGLELTL